MAGTKFFKVSWFWKATTYFVSVCGDVLIDAGERVAALAGPFADAETLTVTRDLLNILGSEHYYTEEYCDVNTDFRSHYLMNLSLRAELE